MREVHNHALGLSRIAPRAGEAFRGVASGLRSRGKPPGRDADLIVCASGNLAHLYFTALPRRMTIDEVEDRYPGLLAVLVGHPAVGIVMFRDEAGSPVVIGRAGRRDLASGRVEGADPLEPYGVTAETGLRRLDLFENTGDMVVVSGIDPDSHEVTSFEPLVGCHGGLGGAQSEAFLLFPAEWTVGAEPIVGADAVHRRIQEWLEPSDRDPRVRTVQKRGR